MTAPVMLEDLLETVAADLPVELSTCYTMRWRGRWPWLVKRGRFLFVDLLMAADYWESAGRRHVAARLRRRAVELRASTLEQQAITAMLRDATRTGEAGGQ